MAPGVGLLDADGDLDLDLYLIQGRPLPAGPGPWATDALFRNDAEPGAPPRFTRIDVEATAQRSAYAMGVAVGDVDLDGRPDLYVTALGRNQLLRNLGDGRFAEVPGGGGADDEGWSVPAVFFDFDRDGWLDLFVGNYATWRSELERPCFSDSGGRDYCGPLAFEAQLDRLYRNRGDGTFEDVTRAAGLARVEPGRALGAVAADFDGDSWPDLYVANDETANHLWMNRGDGTFEENALLAGCAVSGEGLAESSMGVETGDLDGDGDFDLLITHLRRQTNTVYLNDGTGFFTDASGPTRLGPPSWAATGFGVGLLDLGLDGWLDVFVANGAVKTIEALAAAGDPFPLHEPDQLFRNLGQGRFEVVTVAAEPGLAPSLVTRGLAVGDLDDDGDLDVLLGHNDGPARLLLDAGASQGHWVGLRLVDAEGRRDQLGAEATLLRTRARPLVRLVQTGGSYGSARDSRIVFGLGSETEIVELRVAWPSGRNEVWPGDVLELGAYRTLREGSGREVP